MDISKDISLLKDAAETDKLEIFKKIINGLLDTVNKDELNVTEKDIEEFCQEILNSLEHSSCILLEQLEFLLKDCKSLKCIFTDNQMNSIVKGIIKVIKVSENEKDLILCFSCLNETLSVTELENDMLEDLLGNAAEIICKKSVPVSVYINICSYMQKCFKHYESKLSCFMHIIPRLIYPPLTHNSGKVREIAEKTLDNFPKLVLYAENEEASNALLKLIKESYCKELLLLFKEKQELYVLKIWKAVVNGLGKLLHRNLPTITPFFQIIEKGFKSQDDEVCKSAFISWKTLISNFAMDDSVLNDSKKLRFVLKPFRNLTKFSELVSFAVCETWWHLAWSLSDNLSARFDEVLMPLLEFTFGKNTKSQIFLVKRGCHILLRLLEQPQNNSLNRISSPKKLPPLMYPSLQVPLDLKVIVRHSKEIMSMIRSVIEMFGNVKDMTSHIDCLLKSVLFVLSSVIEDKNKESVEAVISFVNFVNDVIDSQLCSPLTCLKCVDSLSKLPRFVLVSHYFHCGPRKQDILCTSLLRLLVNPYLFSTEISNKRFLMAYNRLIQAGLGESLNPLSMAHKLINIVKQVTAQNLDAEILFEMWSGIASPLLEAIEKTQEVNQGTGQEHDFSCLYDVLLCPFDNIFPVSLNQLRTKPAFRLWTNLYKTFVRCASLVPTTLPNEACEHFCARLKNYFKDELLKEPQYFETVCFLLQVVLESIDFTSASASSTPVFASPSMLLKKKKPLGNLTSFVELLSMLLTSFYTNYIENEDDIYQQPLLLEESCTPKAQRKGHISKAAAPLDLVKTFFGNLKTGVAISSALEELVPSLSKLFAISLTKTQIGTKLEVFWNVLTSAIEMHYLGQYDTDFLIVMCPLLESCFTHPRRHIKERSRRFWFATFAPVSSSLIIPESLKTILKKSKLSLMPDEQVSSLEDCSLNPASDSIEDEVINFEKCSGIKDSFVKPLDVKPKDLKCGVRETDSKQIKDKKLGYKKSVDELPNDEFVIIDSPAAGSLTPKRRSFRRRKSFVPAMYNDLSQSQETTTLGGSSESFDTSSSCEIIEFKSQEDSEKLIASNQELDFGKNKEEITSKKVEESQDINSSIEVLSNQNDTDCSERKNLISQETKTTENETTSKNEKALLEKETTFSKICKNDGHSAENIKSSDVIVVTSSDSISSQEVGVDSKNAFQEMPNSDEIGVGLSDPKSPSFSQGESRLSQRHGRKRSSSDELLNSQELINNKDSSEASFDNSVKDRESVSKEKNDTIIIKKGRVESDSDETQDSQKNINKKFKSNTESTTNTLALPKKNGKSKQNGSATHLKKTSKSDYKKSLQQKNLSESLPLCTVSNKLDEQTILSKSNQSCIEIIDLDDSDDIIPSSQSSGDSMSCIKLPAKDMSPINSRRMLAFDSPKDSENKSNKIEVKSETNFAKDCIDQNVNNSFVKESNECPETPTDLIQPSCDDIVADVVNQASTFVTKTISSMPLKSSENLVILDEHLNKTENKTIKTALSDVLMKTDDEKKMLIAENKPPLFTDIYTVQTSEPVIVLDKLCIEEEKIKPSVEIKFAKSADSVENVFKEDSPKTVRVKSLRSANKNIGRKSFSCAGNKKISKRPSKRKSMPALNAAPKINKLDIEDENMDSETNFDQLTLNEMVKLSENNSQTKNESKDTDEYPASVEGDSEQNSVLEDINKVILDIQDKIMSYDEGYSCDLYVNGKLENEQDIDKSCLLSPSNQVDKDLKKQDEKLKDSDVKKLEISNNNHNICKVIENTGNDFKALSEDQSEVDLYSNSTKKSDVIDTNSDLENEKSQVKTVFSLHNMPITNETSVSDANLKAVIPVDDLVNSAQLTENQDVELSKFVEDKLLDHVSEDTNNVETQNFEIKADLQLDADSDVDSCGQDFNLKSQDEKEGNKIEIIIDKNNTSDETAFKNIETHEVSELIHDETVQDHQIKILDVVSVKEKYTAVFENFDKESVPNSDNVDILGSSEKNLCNNTNNICIKEIPEEETKNKSSETVEVSATAETNKIDPDIKVVPDSFSSEIEEIEETCDIDDQRFTKKTEEVILEQKNIQRSRNDDGSKNDILELHENIIKPELNGILQIEESCITKDLNEKKQENEKCIESEVSETHSIKNLESGINKNMTVIKLKSDLELPVDPKTDLQMSALEIYDVENHCIHTDSHKNLEDEKSVEFHNSDTSNILTVSKTSSVSQINNNEMESSSRRRKPKCPVRSPFNFRQRSNLIVSMSNILPKDGEPNSGKIASKKTVQNKTPENAVKKIKKHIEPKIKTGSSITSQNSNKLDSSMNNSNSSHEPSDQELKKAASSSVKRLKVCLNLKEMTDVNTRFNASVAPQTRRLKMLADVHNLQPLEDDDPTSNENDSVYTEDDDLSASMSSTSILKKRKASSDGSHSKIRKVTFADPLVEERLFSNDDNLSERILRVSAQMNILEQQNSISSSDVEKVAETNLSSSEEMPSSSEYQSSDNLTDYNNLPISPLLVNCEESISCIIKDLTSPTWAQGLMTLLLAKNIKTIGDLCKLNVHELKDLPIKSPKVSCLHKALLAHLQHTQEVTASKLNSTENWYIDSTSSENRNKENEPEVNHEDEKMDESISSEVLERIAEELLTDDRIGQIKKETLLALSKKCFQEVTKRLEDH
ncbi:Telomere-associated protein RIF1 like protein [Argiope bruennichi]|uniref:Telomere-associated protein RIF1 like protein n=1 Tax=Argiope bruennichi TaxID=94029 RepID=A0A8T0FU68_ARGBR|nr:Telomere-associated protein RIF1 like protein [Argiope bruennichi]